MNKPRLTLAALTLMSATAWTPAPSLAGEPYLRLDLGGSFAPSSSLTDAGDCTAPTALLGCNADWSGGGSASPVFSGGLGYQALPWLRGDVAFGYRPLHSLDARPSSVPELSITADTASGSLLATIYLDFAGFFPDTLAQVRPYIGAGAGVAINSTDAGALKLQGFPEFNTTLEGRTTVQPAWSITAGAAVPITDTISLNLGWRFTDLGKAQVAGGQACVTAFSFCTPVDPVEQRLQVHEFSVGIRWGF